MSCIIALTLATTLALREPPRTTLVRRETIIQARDPLITETGTPADKKENRRPSMRATVYLPSQVVIYVTETKEDVMLGGPCLPGPALTAVNTPRVEADPRPPP